MVVESIKFQTWLEQRQGVVSLDFDGVLHTDVHPGTISPVEFFTSDLSPNYKMHQKLREEARNHPVIIVTARDNGPMKDVCWDFVSEYNLPVKKIYATDGRPKEKLLSSLGVIRHYDDNGQMAEGLKELGIEFVHVNPFSESTAGDSMMATPKTIHDRGLFRPQNWKPPRVVKKNKKDKIDKLFKGK